MLRHARPTGRVPALPEKQFLVNRVTAPATPTLSSRPYVFTVGPGVSNPLKILHGSVHGHEL
jgi:hypothetical protein